MLPERFEPPAVLDPSENPIPLARRLKFLGLGAEDVERLRSLEPLFQEFADEFVVAFYRHLYAFPETAALLRDPVMVERLKQAQRAHFESLLTATWNDDYVTRRLHIGKTHADVGLSPDLFLGAYSQYAEHCFRRFLVDLDLSQQDHLESLLAVLKAIFLDIGLTLDAYFARSMETTRKALDMLWKANVELKQFAHLASHDLKTPLATVANLCDEAVDEFGEQMPAEARKLIEAAKQRTYRMSRMIDELLSISTFEEGVEGNTHISSREAIGEAVDRLRPAIDEKGIILKLPAELPDVWGNKIRLREAFYNLLANAVQFSDKQPGRITIEAQQRDRECLFCVADNGPGIPADDHERIFSPFRRLAAHRDVPGSGLGLYFTRSMIEQQRGRVWVESDVGQGSRFYVLLRLQPPA